MNDPGPEKWRRYLVTDENRRWRDLDEIASLEVESAALPFRPAMPCALPRCRVGLATLAGSMAHPSAGRILY